MSGHQIDYPKNPRSGAMSGNKNIYATLISFLPIGSYIGSNSGTLKIQLFYDIIYEPLSTQKGNFCHISL